MTNQLKIIISVLLTLISCNIYGQKIPAYAEYGANDKEIIFNEDFSVDRDTNWVSENDSSAIIKDGNLYCSYKKGDFEARGFEPNVDEKRDFEIEFSGKVPYIPYRKYKGNLGILFWGRKDSTDQTNYWVFGYSRKITFNKILRNIDTNDFHIYYENESKMKSKDFNKYTLRKIGAMYYFYMNELFITQVQVLPFFGKVFGIGSGNNHGESMAIFDYIRVSYLKKQH